MFKIFLLFLASFLQWHQWSVTPALSPTVFPLDVSRVSLALLSKFVGRVGGIGPLSVSGSFFA